MREQVFEEAAHRLDVERRAWVVGIGQHVEAPAGLSVDEDDLRRVLDSAYASGNFPVGAGAYVCHEVSIKRLPTHSQAILRACAADGSDFLEYQIGFAPNGYLGVAMTRSGHFPGSAPAPGHVLLADVEAVVLDLAVLIDHSGRILDRRGANQFSVAVLSDIPGHPLRLRCLDVDTGELCPPRPGDDPELFHPVSVRLHPEMDTETGHRLLYQALTEVAGQFGVEEPQLLPNPDRTQIDYDRAGFPPATAAAAQA